MIDATLIKVMEQFGTEDKCRAYLESLRWPEGVSCPRCNCRSVSQVMKRSQYDCNECRYQFSVKAGTIFNDSHLPLSIWFIATVLLCEAKKGMSAHQLKRTIWGTNNGSYKTAWYLCHRIRAAMKTTERPMLDGTVEIDETYIGGKARGKAWRRLDNDKEIVIGIRQRSTEGKPGEVRFFHAEDARKGTLTKYIQEHISRDVDVIVTDDLPAYPSAVGGIEHKTVNHTAKEYVRYEDGFCVTTNTIESAFSLLKRGIIGSWHKISAKHLAAYLTEMEFRFNRRKSPYLFQDTLRHMVTADPLTFDRLTAEIVA